MTETISSRELDDHIGEYLILVRREKKHFVITQRGQRAAVLVPVEDYERWQRLERLSHENEERGEQ